MKKRLTKFVLAGVIAGLISIPVSAAEIDTTMFEKMKAPDYEMLEIDIEEGVVSDYTMDACDGRVYITGDALTVEHDRKESPVVLIYDETENNWSTIWATFLGTEGELDIVAGDGMLYFFDNQYTKLNILGYNLETKEVKELSSFTREQSERGNTLVYGDDCIWLLGGEYQDTVSGQWHTFDAVRRWDIETGQLENVELSEEEKAEIFAEGEESKLQEEQMLINAKEALAIIGNDSLTGTVSEGYFYVYGDVQTGDSVETVFYRFVIKEEVTEDEAEQNEPVEEPEKEAETKDETAVEDTEAMEKDGEEGMTLMIVVFCVAIMLVGSIVQILHKKRRNRDVIKGDEK